MNQWNTCKQLFYFVKMKQYHGISSVDQASQDKQFVWMEDRHISEATLLNRFEIRMTLEIYLKQMSKCRFSLPNNKFIHKLLLKIQIAFSIPSFFRAAQLAQYGLQYHLSHLFLLFGKYFPENMILFSCIYCK